MLDALRDLQRSSVGLLMLSSGLPGYYS